MRTAGQRQKKPQIDALRAHPRAVLKPGRDKSVRRRHPWIFSGAIERIEGEPGPGSVVAVLSHAGEPLALAGFSPVSQIRLRVLCFDSSARIDAGFIRARLERAVTMRRELGLLDTVPACRLVFGEADALPGLVVDRYGDYLVCQFLAAAMEPWRDAVVAALVAILAPRGISERSEAPARRKEGLDPRRGLLAGAAPPEPLELGGALRQLVHLEQGQKTGAYLDQRENRARVAAYAEGRRVLDAFAYTGGFGLECLARGAVRAMLIDSSAAALELAVAQAALNGLAGRCEVVAGDVGERLRALAAAGERFDVVVLDPPKFVATAAQLRAGCRAYKDMNRLAFELLRSGGLLATFSCSGHVDATLLQKVVAGAAVDAGREAQVIERLSQPADHPVALNFPEAEYLKGLVLRVV